MWQKEVKQLLVGLRVKSSPLGSRQGWQQPHKTLVHARVLCQAVPGQQTRVRQKAEAAPSQQRVLHSPGAARATLPLGQAHSPLCPERTFQLAPALFALLPIGTESCRGMGEPLPPTRLLQGSTWPSAALKMKQKVFAVHNVAGHAGRCVLIKNQCSNQVSGE